MYVDSLAEFFSRRKLGNGTLSLRAPEHFPRILADLFWFFIFFVHSKTQGIKFSLVTKVSGDKMKKMLVLSSHLNPYF